VEDSHVSKGSCPKAIKDYPKLKSIIYNNFLEPGIHRPAEERVKSFGRILLITIGILWIVVYWLFDLLALTGSVLAFVDRKIFYHER